MVRTCWHLRQNPEFIQAVVTGQQHVSDLASMDVKEMASESMKKQRGKYHENAKMALMDTKSFEKYIGKEINDGILKCPKCKSMKTEYTEVQTRSADEPTTKKCFCNSCNYRWKCAASHCAHMKAHTSRLPSPSIPCHQVLLTLCGSISHVFFFSWPFFAAAVLLLQHERFDVAKGLATEGKRARVVVCVHWRGAECISLSFLVYPRTISGHFCVYSRSPVTTN